MGPKFLPGLSQAINSKMQTGGIPGGRRITLAMNQMNQMHSRIGCNIISARG